MSDIFLAIADPKRREILEALAKEEQTLAQLAKAIKETPAATTKQLTILKDDAETEVTVKVKAAVKEVKTRVKR